MNRANSVKQKLAEGKTVWGVFANGLSVEMVEIMGLAGFDFVCIDSEHGPSSDETNRLLVMAGESRGVPVFVRPRDKSDAAILRSLDIGAQGLLIPQVNSKAEAEGIVRAARYAAPGALGRRGVGLGRAADYGMGQPLADYFETANREIHIAVQCENSAAVPALDDIAQVPGIEAIFIGPYDLSASMGIPGKFGDPRIGAVMDRVLEVCARRSLAPGIFTFDLDQALEYEKRGFRYIIAGSDVHFLSEAASAAVKKLKRPRNNT
jgi:4-hydroxy-2-oxoheptanedioate aldolase